jgi:hypothetical protein
MTLISTDVSPGLRRMLRIFRGLQHAGSDGWAFGYTDAAEHARMSYDHTVIYAGDLVARGLLERGEGARFRVTAAGDALLNS